MIASILLVNVFIYRVFWCRWLFTVMNYPRLNRCFFSFEFIFAGVSFSMQTDSIPMYFVNVECTSYFRIITFCYFILVLNKILFASFFRSEILDWEFLSLAQVCYGANMEFSGHVFDLWSHVCEVSLNCGSQRVSSSPDKSSLWHLNCTVMFELTCYIL